MLFKKEIASKDEDENESMKFFKSSTNEKHPEGQFSSGYL